MRREKERMEKEKNKEREVKGEKETGREKKL